jgi:hypothetical protein
MICQLPVSVRDLRFGTVDNSQYSVAHCNEDADGFRHTTIVLVFSSLTA